jgi:hypothetical protein
MSQERLMKVLLSPVVSEKAAIAADFASVCLQGDH